MADKNTSVTVDEAVLDQNDKIREALQEQDPYNRVLDRSSLVERLLADWNEDNKHVLADSP